MWWLVAAACGAPELKFVESGAPDAQLPLIVALHGYGDTPENQLALVESCGLSARIVAPRGPKKHPSGQGAAWYAVQFTPGGPVRDVGDALNAADQVARFIQSYTARRPSTKVVVTGFSQGGILSFGVATRYPKLVDEVVPISGAVLEVVPARAGAPRIRALHGAEDELLPARDVVDKVEALKAAGWDAEVQVFPDVAHEIPQGVRAAMCAELGRAIGGG
jgi:phospholipase/carboxylesterase